MKPCIFCQIIAKQAFAYIVYEDDQLIAILDKNPQSRGHLQLMPKKHFRWLYEIPEIGTFFETAQKIIHGIIPALGAHHVSIATFGREIEHAHLWIVPQYKSEVFVTEGQQTKEQYQKELKQILSNALEEKFKAQSV